MSNNPIDSFEESDLDDLATRDSCWPERRLLCESTPSYGLPPDFQNRYEDMLKSQMDQKTFNTQYLGNFTDDREYDDKGRPTGRRYRRPGEQEHNGG